MREPVRGACEMLGLDPLYVANEGKLLAFVAPEDVERVLAAMRAHPDGRERAIIGEVVADPGRHRRAADAHRRTADRGHAAGRPAPAHLLGGEAEAIHGRWWNVRSQGRAALDSGGAAGARRERLPLGPIKTIHVYWLAGMSCDGCTIAVAGATNPGIEGLLPARCPRCRR